MAGKGFHVAGWGLSEAGIALHLAILCNWRLVGVLNYLPGILNDWLVLLTVQLRQTTKWT